MKSRKLKVMIITLVLTMLATSVTVFAGNYGYSFSFGSSYEPTTHQYVGASTGTGIDPYINQNSTTSYATTYYMTSSRSSSSSLKVTGDLPLAAGAQSNKYFSCKSNYSKTGSYYLGAYRTGSSYYGSAYTASGRWFS